jgi:hypothetical protein
MIRLYSCMREGNDATTFAPTGAWDTLAEPRSLHHISAREERKRLIEQSDRLIDGARTKVHISSRRRQVLVACQFLNGPDRRAAPCQVRTERMPQDMRPVISQACPTCHAPEQINQMMFSHR